MASLIRQVSSVAMLQSAAFAASKSSMAVRWIGAYGSPSVFHQRRAQGTTSGNPSTPQSSPTTAPEGTMPVIDYQNIQVSQVENVGVVTLNRPKVRNALSDELTSELVYAVNSMDADKSIGAIVISGGPSRVFAAGADIKQMAARSMSDQAFRHRAGEWIDVMARVRKPLIAAVNGFALGGGCELAMACDIIIAGESAQFGQPEVQIGTIPGWGGTQRLIRAVGKAKAMELILTGRRMSAQEAESAGLVSRVMPDDNVFDEALNVAKTIASYSAPIVELAKQCVLMANESPLSAGLQMERKVFHSTFGLDDQKEGMLAFLDKRPPHWRNK